MAEKSQAASFDVTPLTGTIGATVTGIDLAQPQSDATMQAIEDTMHRHSVLFFLGQQLDDASHRRFGQWFGELDVHHSRRNAEGYPEIYVLEGYSRDIEWHADVTFSERPARASVLRPVALPSVGGDTIWTSTCFAYDALSSSMQRFVDGLHARHDSSALNNRDKDLPIIETVHPVVIDHPWTGERSIFVNPMFTKNIVELEPEESARVLEVLYRAVQLPSHQVRWKWRPDAVAMWDNFATQHYVVNDYTEHRSMRRVTIKGRRPTSQRLEASSARAAPRETAPA